MRALPTLLGVIPVIGGLLNLAVAIVSVFLVSEDHERRSAYDVFIATTHSRRRCPQPLREPIVDPRLLAVGDPARRAAMWLIRA